MPFKLLSLPIRIGRSTAKPLQQQIFIQIEQQILSGALGKGDRLPSVQELAEQLHVSKNTVLGAYERLAGEGLTRSERGKGHFVDYDREQPIRSIPVPAAQPDVDVGSRMFDASGVHIDPPVVPVGYDFRIGRPSPQAFPVRVWRAYGNSLLHSAPHYMAEYAPAGGLSALRARIADFLFATKAIRVAPEQVVIVSGIQEALSLLAAHFLERERRVAVESPCYSGFFNLLKLHGAEILPVPVDSEGIVTDCLPQDAVSLLYVTPSHQYPLGHSMSFTRREALIDWAARTGAYILEDDYDGDFVYEEAPLPALMAMRGDRVFHLGTFSKTLGPGLRLAYMVCPPGFSEAMIARKSLLNNACAWLDQAILVQMFEGEDYLRHVRWLRKIYKRQRDLLVSYIDGIWQGRAGVTGTRAGVHLALHLPDDGPDALSISQAALAAGVRIYTFAESACSLPQDKAMTGRILLFGYAALSAEKITVACDRLAAVMQRLMERESSVEMMPGR